MKLLIVSTVLLCCVSAFSQNNKSFISDLSPKYPLYRYDLKQNRILDPFDKNMAGIQNLQTLSHFNGGLVYLPQDNMPCIVPPNATQAIIPNLWHAPVFPMTGIMPNPAQPLDIKKIPLLSYQTDIENSFPMK